MKTIDEVIELWKDFESRATAKRSTQISRIKEAVRSINHQNEDINSEVILFDLNTNNIKRFKSEDYEKIFHHRSNGSI